MLVRSVIGALIAATAVATATVAQDRSREQALSRLLLDQPSHTGAKIPGGVKGACTNPRTVDLFEERPCVFHIFEGGLNENGDHNGTDWVIDANKVTGIAVELIDRPKLDPAVARLYRIRPAIGKAVRVTFTGTPDQRQEVFCQVKVCWGHALSFLQPAAQLEHARQAAVAFRKLCPGPESQ